jgi:hypothetical protein
MSGEMPKWVDIERLRNAMPTMAHLKNLDALIAKAERVTELEKALQQIANLLDVQPGTALAVTQEIAREALSGGDRAGLPEAMSSKGRRTKETRGQYPRCKAIPCKRKAVERGFCALHAVTRGEYDFG